MAEIRIDDGVTLDEREVDISFARSGGPGGQHVNTASTKVELRFEVDASSLSDTQKARIRQALQGRLTKDGVLVLHASEHRSQARNREAALARLADLLREALRPSPPARRATWPSRAARERRLDEKRRRAQSKRLRRPPDPSQ